MQRLAIAVCLVSALLLAGLSEGNARKLKDEAAAEAAREAASYIASIDTLSAPFEYRTPRGKTSGYLFMDRERQAIRMQFGPPLDHLLLVNGPEVRFFAGDGTILDISSEGTPFKFLLRPSESLDDQLDVLEVEVRDAVISLVLAERENPGAGQVIMKFQREPDWRLLEWSTFDSKGRFTQTVLERPETGLRLDEMLFQPPL